MRAELRARSRSVGVLALLTTGWAVAAAARAYPPDGLAASPPLAVEWPVPTDGSHVRPMDSPRWTGYMLDCGPSYCSGSPFEEISACWHVPAATAPAPPDNLGFREEKWFPAPDVQQDTYGIWIGLGGESDGAPLVQLGTDIFVADDGSPPIYHAWTDVVWPGEPALLAHEDRLKTFPVAANDLICAGLELDCKKDMVHFAFWNLTQGAMTGRITKPAHGAHGRTAEWVVEWPNNGGTGLADFGTTKMKGWAKNGFGTGTLYNPDGSFASEQTPGGGRSNVPPRGFRPATAYDVTQHPDGGDVLSRAYVFTREPDTVWFDWNASK